MARPLKEINWDVVDQCMESGCSGVEIAGKFRIQKQTFYERFKKEYGCSFQDYHTEAQEGGLADIRRMLHGKAINNQNPGNAHLLIFLARCRLGMKEPETVVNIAANQAQIDQSHIVMQQAHEIETLKAIIEANAHKPETESELLRSDPPIQHMGGGGSVGEDLCEY